MAAREEVGTRRVAGVILAVVLGVSLVGFAVGIRPASEPAGAPGVRPVAAAAEGVVASRPYRALRQTGRFGAGDRVTSDLKRLRAGFPGLEEAVVRSDEAKRQALSARAARRAYDGAPPVIPHPISHGDTGGDCLACHEDGVQVAGRTASVMSHRPLASCTQCHVSLAPDLQAGAVAVDSSFAGITSPGPGERAWPGAPPRIPHRLSMREQCGSCHGLTGQAGLRTTHPGRGSCTQCHVASGGGLPW